MSEEPVKSSLFMTNWLVKRMGIVTALIAAGGAVMGFANQAEVQEPHWLATRSYVRDTITSSTAKIESRQLQIQLYLARTERSRIENELANKQVLLTQNPNMPAEVRRAIEEQIRALTRDLEAAKSSYDDLRREQAGRRP